MNKTPEEMAEEYAFKFYLNEDSGYAMTMNRDAFLAGYAAAQPKWISVKERLPEIGEWVLINGPEVCQRIEPPSASWKAEYAWNTDHETFYYPEDITHWMPLPAPPKEEA